MPERKSVKLAIIRAPQDVLRALDAPPILIASTNTVDYCCGNCPTVLMHADDGQVYNLMIRCTVCGSYNLTNN
jgi:hypothetical protein